MNKKGFTLVELLAVLVILGIVMMVAVPNTVSVLDKNKKRTFVSDAKRFAGLVETEIRKDETLDVPTGDIMVFYLSYINDGTFDKDPDNGEYSQDKSFIAVKKEKFSEDSGIYVYKYYVYLQGKTRAVELTELSLLSSDNAIDHVTKNSAQFNESAKDILSSKNITGTVELEKK